MVFRLLVCLMAPMAVAGAGVNAALPVYFDAPWGTQADARYSAVTSEFVVHATEQGLALQSWEAPDEGFTIRFEGHETWVGKGAADFAVRHIHGDGNGAVQVDGAAYTRLWRPGSAGAGIDYEVYVADREIEFDFIVAPGVNPDGARFEIIGADCLRLDDAGALYIEVGATAFMLKAPVAYQHTAQGRTEIACHFDLGDTGHVGFQLGEYDAHFPLIIDPIIRFASYIGGDETRGGSIPGLEEATSVAIDNDGNLYVAGTTFARNLPTANALNAGPLGNALFRTSEAFLAKYDSDRNLVYLSYLGGSGSDTVNDMAIDANGVVYLTGSTDSPNFPLVNNIPGTSGTDRDAYVLALNSAGNTVLFSTKLGGSRVDIGRAIAVDGVGNVFVTGFTGSTNFPMASPFQRQLGGSLGGAFVARINTATSNLVFSTYLSGSGRVIGDQGEAIAVNDNGEIVVVGSTGSSDFPLANPRQGTLRGLQDGFVSKFSATGQLLFSSYLGGATTAAGLVGNTTCTAVAWGPESAFYVLGHSSAVDLPVTATALQPTLTAPFAQFVVKYEGFNPSISAGTYLGSTSGAGSSFSSGIDVNGQGQVAIAGISAALDFPVVAPVQAALAGNFDATVTVLDATLSFIEFSTYFGSDQREDARDIAFNEDGTKVALVGKTSGNIPLSDPTQATASGPSEGFIVEIDFSIDPSEGEGEGDEEGEGEGEEEGIEEGEDPEGEGEEPEPECASVCPGTGLDSDGDGLSDICEQCLGTNLFVPDTDGDGMSDGFEYLNGFDPLNPGSTPGRRDGPNDDFDGDGLSNLQEFWLSSDPRDPNSPDRVFFVATDGLDEPAGGTREAPWATINFALAQLNPSPAFPVRIFLEPGVYTEDVVLRSGVTLSSVEGFRAVIQGRIRGANNSRLERVSVVAQEDGDALVTLDGVNTVLSRIIFQSGGQQDIVGVLALGDSSRATITDGTFTGLAIGVEVQGTLPILRRSVFTRLSGSGVVIRGDDKRFTTVGKSLGSAQDPETGFNTFRLDISGPAVVNEREEPVTVQLADWDLTPPIDPAAVDARIEGPADFGFFLPQGSAILAAAFFCTVIEQGTQDRVTNAAVTLQVSTYPANTNNQDGVYPFPAMADGTYKVIIESEGFKRATRDLILAPGQTKSLVVTLVPEDDDPAPPPPGCACPNNAEAAKEGAPLKAQAGDAILLGLCLSALLGLGISRRRRQA